MVLETLQHLLQVQVSVSGTTVSIGQSVATNADVDFATVTTTGNAIIGGNLTVSGGTTTLNTATLDVEDQNITLNEVQVIHQVQQMEQVLLYKMQ